MIVTLPVSKDSIVLPINKDEFMQFLMSDEFLKAFPRITPTMRVVILDRLTEWELKALFPAQSKGGS